MAFDLVVPDVTSASEREEEDTVLSFKQTQIPLGQRSERLSSFPPEPLPPPKLALNFCMNSF